MLKIQMRSFAPPFKILRKRVLSSVLSLALTPFCALSAQALPSDPLTALQLQTQKLWRQHLEDSANTALQEGCAPYYLAPKTQRPRGALLLIHGFTACAQQNDVIAPLLAAQGYHVFVPRVPGHGLPARRTDEGWQDNLSQMIEVGEVQRYRAFAHSLAELLQSESGIKGVVGVSLGATLALSVALQAPHQFDRALIMTPLFDVSPPRDILLPVAAAVLPNYRLHWGEICDQERLKGRGGYCEFAFTHLKAIQRFGLETLSQLQDLGVRTQYVGVEGDTAASNPAMLRAHQRSPFSAACLYAQGTSHSMLSPFDNQHEEKFWFSQLHQQSLRFLNTGQYFDTQGPASESGFQQCVSR